MDIHNNLNNMIAALEKVPPYVLPPHDLRPIMLESAEEIKDWLTNLDIFEYDIHEDLSVSVREDVRYNPTFMTKPRPYLPLNFRKIEGDFIWPQANLKTLQGAPQIVSGIFDCAKNNLNTLDYAPMYVGHTFNCSYNSLSSLKGAPLNDMEFFICQSNLLTQLDTVPRHIRGSFNCRDNLLTSLVGSPLTVGGDFDCANNQLINLEGLPVFGGSFMATENKLVSLKGLPDSIGGDLFVGLNCLTNFEGAPEYVSGNFDCVGNPIKSIKGFRTRIGSHEVFNCPPDIEELKPFYDEKIGGVYDFDLEKVLIIIEEKNLMEQLPEIEVSNEKRAHKI